MHWDRVKIQIIALIAVNSYFFSILKYIPCPILNCYACPLAVTSCPIGTIQHFLVVGRIPFYTIGILGITGTLFGRMTCGWICPFGFLQERLYRIPAKKIRVSENYSIFRFIVLSLMIIVPLITLDTWFCKLCPVGTLEAGIPLILLKENLRTMVGTFFYVKIVVLIIFIYLMIVVKNPFCRFVCPLGAIFSLFNPFSRAKLEVDDKCIKCGECKESCPMDIDIHLNPNSMSCIRCLECTKSCEHIKFTMR
jgi:polyferredoxin